MYITLVDKMSDQDRICANNAMEKIIGNMTPEMQNIDGQYVPLGYQAPPENLTWNHQPQNTFVNRFHNPEQQMYNHLHQFGQTAFSYGQQPQPMFIPNMYKHRTSLGEVNYDMCPGIPRNTADIDMYDPNYLLLSQNAQRSSHMAEHLVQNQPEPLPQSSSHTHLIENLVGNLMMPNTTGTYSQFGNGDAFKTNIGVFDTPLDKENSRLNMIRQPDENQYLRSEFDDKFQFNRDIKKPRMVAEVKPMRPTYSDVLTKSVPQQTLTKPTKNDLKEAKLKKESNKKSKTDKIQKVNVVLSRSNTNNDINLKDVNVEKTTQIRGGEKVFKTTKPIQLDRKWASLDNITEPLSNKNEKSRKKESEEIINKSFSKTNVKRVNKNVSDITDNESGSSRIETSLTNKNGIKKGNKLNSRAKCNDSFGSNERPPGKRHQRVKKRETMCGIIGQKLQQYLKGWWKISATFIIWLFQLISDICSLSIHLSRDIGISSWSWLCVKSILFLTISLAIIKRIRILTWMWEKFKRKEVIEEANKTFTHSGLQYNLNMPSTGEEAMKRLLACKGKDPYSILGVSPNCSDDDIKRYYKRQAFLVHPDKNQQPGAEEAFKILVHAFDMIGVPEKRACYDRGVAESAQVEQAWSELTELLAQLQKKVESAANTIRCSACGLRHKRIKSTRPIYAARNCSTCKIHHSAREGDIWAEAQCFGFLWHYFACMEGSVYDITEWAGCQKDSLKHLKPDSHHVQYRIALGKQQNNQPRRQSGSPRNDRPPDMEKLLNSLYGQADASQPTRKRNKKTNK